MAPPVVAQLPVPEQCVADSGGANDVAGDGQKDLTQWCVDFGDGGPYELHAKWNWDEIALSGGNTGDACTLYDTDGDGNANFAVCVSWGNAGVQLADSPRLYTCTGDANPDRCSQPTQINLCSASGGWCLQDSDCPAGDTCGANGGFNTQCEVNANVTDDPFPAGDEYPLDTEAVCAIDLDDFGVAGPPVLIDTCSFPSAEPNSAPSDCVVTAACSVDTDCNDGNECTLDVCDTGLGICRFTPNTGASCGDPSDTECDNPDTCNSLGFCQDNNEPAGFACGDPSDTPCDDPDTCDGAGLCQDNFAPAGDPGDGATCDDGNDCTSTSTNAGDPDLCDGAGACDYNFVGAGGACGDQSDTPCDDPDTCDGAGLCQDNYAPAGDPGDGATCDDGNECTSTSTNAGDPDLCDGAGACDYNFVGAGGAC
ncbi:MAG: hypothetical protein ACYTHJ_03495, partial [Planctomycetota bacterium]